MRKEYNDRFNATLVNKGFYMSEYDGRMKQLDLDQQIEDMDSQDDQEYIDAELTDDNLSVIASLVNDKE